jgi:methylenetetrahydrofolate dehydrogenase (NADP+)/methenyltetrahydrofolate cyclohydrolase
LSIVRVGDNAASTTYIKHKLKFAEAIGVPVELTGLDQPVSTGEVAAKIQQLNANPQVNGILVQLPLPATIDTDQVLQAISPQKDVDGLTPSNAGLLAQGRPGIIPATARAVVTLLEHYRIPLAGQNVVIVGRSRLVGTPLALLCVEKHATVSIAHRQTRQLAQLCHRADIIVSATGQAHLITSDFVRPDSIVIDVGIVRTPDGLVGDVDPSIQNRIDALSPVPGGVGPLTVACLFENLVQAFQQQHAT